MLKGDPCVIGLDNNYMGNLKNAHSFLENPNFKLVNDDGISPINFAEKTIKFTSRLVLPLRGIVRKKLPFFPTKTYVLRALNVLELAKRNSATILQASTSEVYGEPKIKLSEGLDKTIAYFKSVFGVK